MFWGLTFCFLPWRSPRLVGESQSLPPCPLNMVSLLSRARNPPQRKTGSAMAERCRPVVPRISQCRYVFQGLELDVNCWANGQPLPPSPSQNESWRVLVERTTWDQPTYEWFFRRKMRGERIVLVKTGRGEQPWEILVVRTVRPLGRKVIATRATRDSDLPEGLLPTFASGSPCWPP